MNRPLYRGSPLSAIIPVPRQEGQRQLWIWESLWYPEPSLHPQTMDAMNGLTEQGCLPSPPGSSAALETQLYEVFRPAPGANDSPHSWYRPVSDALPRPVVLAFSIEANPHAGTIPMLNPLPLPQLGEYALVENSEQGFHIYPILQLPLEARQRWVALGEALKTLSDPLLWPAFTQGHQTASDEHTYHLALQAMDAQQKQATERLRTDLLTQSARLTTAHDHVEQLQQMVRKADWLERWQEIQHMAQELADDYYHYHTRIHQPAAAAPLPGPALVPETGKPEPASTLKKRRAKAGAVPAVASKEAISIQSDIINREIINSLRDKSTYMNYPDQRLAEHQHRFYQKNKGQIIISIRPLEGESWETVLQALNTLGDGCIDTYIAAMAVAIDKNGTQHIRLPFQINPDDILAICGKKKSNGSYTPFQRAEVIKHLKTLSQAHVVATMPGRQAPGKRGSGRRAADGGTIFRAEGALIDLLSWKIGEYHTITGEEVWERRSIAIGEWATMIPELNPKTATMLRLVLAYSAKNERYQKRLGVYLTFMFRINARHGGSFPDGITMGALLEGAGIVPPRQQGEFKEALEKALGHLKHDNVVGDYWRIVESTSTGQALEKEIREHGHGWFDAYLQQKWNFSPPQAIQEQYRKLLKSAPEDEGGGNVLV